MPPRPYDLRFKNPRRILLIYLYPVRGKRQGTVVSLASCSVLSTCINPWFIIPGVVAIDDNEFFVQVYVPNKTREVIVFEASWVFQAVLI